MSPIPKSTSVRPFSQWEICRQLPALFTWQSSVTQMSSSGPGRRNYNNSGSVLRAGCLQTTGLAVWTQAHGSLDHILNPLRAWYLCVCVNKWVDGWLWLWVPKSTKYTTQDLLMSDQLTARKVLKAAETEHRSGFPPLSSPEALIYHVSFLQT